jgi:hypothetical protein
MIVALLLFSCASDEEKTPSVEVDLANRAFDLSEEVKESFLKGDTEALKRLCSKALYNKLSSKTGELSGWKIDFKMRWVDIDEEGIIHMYISWKRDSGREEENIDTSGLALFVIKEDPFIVDRIMRENPFLL